MSTRRRILTGLALAPVAAVPAVAAVPLADSESLDDRINRLATELKEAMIERHGGHFKIAIDHRHQFAIVTQIGKPCGWAS